MRAVIVVLTRIFSQPELRLSDLPAVHYTPVSQTLVASLTPPPSNVDFCSRFKACFKCVDRDDICGWCTAADGSGKCVSLSSGIHSCVNLGGTLGDMSSCKFLTTELFITSALIAVCALLSAGGGIGGGALFVPIYLMVYGLTAHQAVPLSKITIFGLGIGGYIVLYTKRHPSRDAPLIDYDMVSLMVPMILLGTIGGVYLNVIFPSFFIITSLVVLLSFTAYRSWKKSFQMYREEQAADKRAKNSIDVELDDLGQDRVHSDALVTSDALQPILQREAATPWRKFALFAITYIGLVVFVLLKVGNLESLSKNKCCTPH